MIVVGEKINGSIPAAARAIAERDADWIRGMARRQAEAGADFIDVCASVEFGEPEALRWMIDLIQSATGIPVSIDSPSAETLVQTYGFCRRPGLFNSVSMEKGKRIDKVFQIMRENPGWKVIAMLSGDDGIPKCAADRLRVLEDIVKKAEEHKIPLSRIYIDPIAEAEAYIDPEQEDGPGISVAAKVVGEIRRRYPALHITSAISNISHGLPERKYMNYSFVVLMLACGLDCGILDPLQEGLLAVAGAAERLLALPKERLWELAVSVREKGPEGCRLLDSGTGAVSNRYMKLAAVILSMKLLKSGVRDMKLDERDQDVMGAAYAAAALLGLEEEGSCVEYVNAFKSGIFGAPGLQPGGRK